MLMYKKIIWFLAMTVVASTAFSEEPLGDTDADALAAADSSFYLETAGTTQLSAFGFDTGGLTLTNQIVIPAESIIAVKLTAFADRTNADWVCGLRLVDVMDEAIRESNAFDEENFCLRASEVKKLKLIDSSNGKNKEAFVNFQRTGSSNELQSLGFSIGSHQKGFTFLAATVSDNIISPLKNCGKGCLQITSEYGPRVHPVYKTRRMHTGLDLKAASGSEVVTVYDGKVLATRVERNRKTGKMKGYGRYVIVVHPLKQLETLYAHLSAFKTTPGKPVVQGDLIALSGNSGIGTAPHLHFEVKVMKNQRSSTTDPRRYLSKLLNVNL